MKITVNVTAKDIREGQLAASLVEGSAKTTVCAVARAFQRATKDPAAYWMYSVGHSKSGVFEARNPKVNRFVEAHDHNKRVLPFKFKAERCK